MVAAVIFGVGWRVLFRCRAWGRHARGFHPPYGCDLEPAPGPRGRFERYANFVCEFDGSVKFRYEIGCYKCVIPFCLSILTYFWKNPEKS